MGTNLNGIIIDGNVYELIKIKRGKEPSCPGCVLYEQCTDWARRGHQPCLITDPRDNHIFRFSPELTEKLKRK